MVLCAISVFLLFVVVALFSPACVRDTAAAAVAVTFYLRPTVCRTVLLPILVVTEEEGEEEEVHVSFAAKSRRRV